MFLFTQILAKMSSEQKHHCRHCPNPSVSLVTVVYITVYKITVIYSYITVIYITVIYIITVM